MNALTVRTALCLGALTLTMQAGAAELVLPRDGWTSWQVDAVAGAPDWCCWSKGDDRDTSRASCRLDQDSDNFGARDHKTTDSVRVYARLASGKVERLRVLSAGCAVETTTPIHELGSVSTDDSSRWMSALAKRNDAIKGDDLRDNVFAALAMHRGEVAQNTLTEIARGIGPMETRKKAVFWLALVRGTTGAEVVRSVMLGDPDRQMRQHAAFAMSQSGSPGAAADLTLLGNTDKDGEVRAQAWFWLAQTDSPGAEAAILAALRKDQDNHVREQAVFALSQLPDERATRALVAVAEDQTLSREQRKRAVFWLAQSETAGAQTYLEKVLLGNAAR